MHTGRFLVAALCVGCVAVSAWGEASDQPTRMLELGDAAPAFALPDVVSGTVISLGTFADKHAVLVAFLCRHCPYVQHVKRGLAELGRQYAGTELAIVAISANDPAAYPLDAPEHLKQMAQEEGFVFPLCFDEAQAVATAYTAVCTPEFFLFDRDRRLVYRGQFDDSRPGNDKPLTGADLRAAIEAVLAGQPIDPNQQRAIGCSIKWKPGNEPFYIR